MGSRLFHTLVGVGISLGVTGTGCLGQTNEADRTAGLAPGGSGGAVGQSQATTTSAATGANGVVTTGSVSGGDATSGADTAASTSAGDGSGQAVSGSTGGSGGAGTGGATAGGGTDWATGSGGAGTGAAGEAGAGSDPFCDTTWPTTKGNPPLPDCVDPHDECEDEPLRCFIVVGEFACDGHFDRAHAPLCVNGTWQCEPGLVPATECKCLAPLPAGHVCTRDGLVPEGQQP